MAGRPTKYNQNVLKQVTKLCLLGATDKQIADFFEIDEATLTRWKKKYPELRTSLKTKLTADSRVAQSLYKRATGYKTQEVTFEKIEGKMFGTTDDMITGDAYKKKILIKEVPPDVIACIFWLKNRQRELWKDKHPIQISDENGIPVSVTLNLSPPNNNEQ